MRGGVAAKVSEVVKVEVGDAKASRNPNLGADATAKPQVTEHSYEHPSTTEKGGQNRFPSSAHHGQKAANSAQLGPSQEQEMVFVQRQEQQAPPQENVGDEDESASSMALEEALQGGQVTEPLCMPCISVVPSVMCNDEIPPPLPNIHYTLMPSMHSQHSLRTCNWIPRLLSALGSSIRVPSREGGKSLLRTPKRRQAVERLWM